MKKTSVYLSKEEHEGLRLLAVREGRPQAQLIRDGIRRVLEEGGKKPRVFKSMGAGHGGGQRARRWDPDELYDWVMGDR